MAWMYLIIAGIFEIVGVIGIKKVAKDNNWTNNIILIGGFIISFQFLTMALQNSVINCICSLDWNWDARGSSCRYFILSRAEKCFSDYLYRWNYGDDYWVENGELKKSKTCSSFL